MRKLYSFFVINIIFSFSIFAQTPQKPNAVDIYNQIEKLNFLGSVLYIAAHPDDENTRMISYFANEVKAATAYLSITRGDGGQNLIGPELGPLLGVIRTQELLEARKIDGGEQFFTRANDFGYSKHPDETLNIWDNNLVMNDVVSVIRSFKPDIIINRFNHKTPGTTHGHHTASAILGMEAFDLASDKNYKTHLLIDETWRPKRLFFNTSWWFYGSRENFEKADKTNLISLDLGGYFADKGLSNGEIAAMSRSMHQSQGFGSAGSRGSQIEYLEFLKGDFPANKNVFEGIDTTWGRLKGGEPIGDILKNVLNEYNFNNPAASLPKLLKAYNLINELENSYWKQRKLNEVKDIIAACSGLFIDVTSAIPATTPGVANNFKLDIINRSNFPVTLKNVHFNITNIHTNNEVVLHKNETHSETIEITLPQELPLTAPYWLTNNGSLGLYNVTDSRFIGLPQTPKSLTAYFDLDFNGTKISIAKDVVYKYTHPVKGEVYQPFEVVPEISVNFNENVFIFSDDKPQTIAVKITAFKDNVSGKLELEIPKEWDIIPKHFNFEIKETNQFVVFEFKVLPPKTESQGYIHPIVTTANKNYSHNLIEIAYDHIPNQLVLIPEKAKIVHLNILKGGLNVGYINGAGDNISTSLRQMGYNVTQLDESQITPDNLSQFNAVVLGIRAYNTNNQAFIYQKYLHDYVENGGTLIVQYNTNSQLKVSDVAPYPLKISRDRVTEENAEVRYLNPNHKILNFPNKITQVDFNNWVQERGLYFPNEWDPRFEPILSMNDKNETPKNGSLLFASYGKGTFIYTGLSFFRQLPAGVPGAYKLFANMLASAENKE
jgi:LmbE family N-acetylglucosaminyl deacetylase